MLGVAKDFEGVAEVEGVKIGVQGEQDLDDLVWAVGGFCNRTHLAGYCCLLGTRDLIRQSM